MFQVEICSQQLEICKSVCIFVVLAIVVIHVWEMIYKDYSFRPDPLTDMAATSDSCIWLADFLYSSALKPFGQMYWSLVGNRDSWIIIVRNVCVLIAASMLVYLFFTWSWSKLFMHVSSRNMFTTTRNLQIRMHICRPSHCCGDWLTFGCWVSVYLSAKSNWYVV
jgi:hypothetical protein